MPPSTTFPWDCFCEISIGRWRGDISLVSATLLPCTSQVLVARGSGSFGDSYCIQRQKKRSLRVTVTPQQGLVGCWGQPRAAPGSLLAAGGAHVQSAGLGFGSVLFSWVTSTSSKDLFDENLLILYIWLFIAPWDCNGLHHLCVCACACVCICTVCI